MKTRKGSAAFISQTDYYLKPLFQLNFKSLNWTLVWFMLSLSVFFSSSSKLNIHCVVRNSSGILNVVRHYMYYVFFLYNSWQLYATILYQLKWQFVEMAQHDRVQSHSKWMLLVIRSKMMKSSFFLNSLHGFLLLCNNFNAHFSVWFDLAWHIAATVILNLNWHFDFFSCVSF